MAIAGEGGIQRYPEQAPLTPRVDGETDEGRRPQSARLHHPQLSGLLGDERAAIGRERHGGGLIQTAHDQLVAEAGRKSMSWTSGSQDRNHEGYRSEQAGPGVELPGFTKCLCPGVDDRSNVHDILHRYLPMQITPDNSKQERASEAGH